MYYTLYLIIFFLTLYALVYGVYRKPTPINSVFFEFRRTERLKNTIRVWMFLLGGVVIFGQWMRLPFYKYLFRQLADPVAVLADGWGALHTIGLFLIVAAEIILIAQWSTYLFYAWVGAAHYRLPVSPPLAEDPPEVIVLIPACNEDPEIMERSISTIIKLDYPNYRAYLVENSRTEEYKRIAVELAEKYGLNVVHVANRGSKAAAMNDALPKVRGGAKYMAVFDVDHEVHSDYLKVLVPILEADDKLAFVQTPQLYENAEENLITRAAAMQEMLLYDTIMEAKGSYQRALCCGSNDLVRIEAIVDVGGWDETTVSEDLATSFLMHLRGWKSVYHRRAFAIGIGPTTLKNYWAQQRRWAEGNTAVAKNIIRRLLTYKFYSLDWKLHLDYLWSAGYYISTLALVYLAIVPMLLTIMVRLAAAGSEWMHVSAARPIEWVYLSVYPLYAVAMMFPYVHMRLRGYALRNLAMLQGLLACTMPIYVGSVLKGILKANREFEITPKQAGSGGFSIWNRPQPFICFLLLGTGAVLFDELLKRSSITFAWILMLWMFIWSMSASHIFIFALQDKLLPKRKPVVLEVSQSSADPEIHVAETEANG
ncbi:glycosyltransferase [bacterium]|nr:glycosyltransferase [bacterium]